MTLNHENNIGLSNGFSRQNYTKKRITQEGRQLGHSVGRVPFFRPKKSVIWVIHTAEIGYVHSRQEMFESGKRALDKEGKVTIFKSIAPARTGSTPPCDAIPSSPKELWSILGWIEPSAPALKDKSVFFFVCEEWQGRGTERVYIVLQGLQF